MGLAKYLENLINMENKPDTSFWRLMKRKVGPPRSTYKYLAAAYLVVGIALPVALTLTDQTPVRQFLGLKERPNDSTFNYQSTNSIPEYLPR